MSQNKYFRIRDVSFNIVNIDIFTSNYNCEAPEVTGGHSLKIACKNKTNPKKIEYFLKIMSVPKKYIYIHFDFVLALNEVMASLVYNKVFKLYGPILHLVYAKDSKQYADTNYLVATKYEDINKHSSHTYEFGDYIKGIIIDSIMANWDISVPGNYYKIDKNANNNTKPDTRFLRLDVGGTLILRAMGEDKLPFINSTAPNELNKDNNFGWLRSQLSPKITPETIKIAHDYLNELYKNNLFNDLEALRHHMLNVINTTLLNDDATLNQIYKQLATKLINFNITQIKRRTLWYINQYNPAITFTDSELAKVKDSIKPKKEQIDYIYPIHTNIICNEAPTQWNLKSPYPGDAGLIDKLNEKLKEQQDDTIRIMTYNIGALNDSNTKQLTDFVTQNKVDIECYQEKTVSYSSTQPSPKNSKHQLECNPTRTGSFGVNTINFNKDTLAQKVNVLTQMSENNDNGFELKAQDTNKKYARRGKCVNVLELEFKESGHKLLIYNVHLDVTDDDKGRDMRINSLKLILSEYEKVKATYPNAIILGDFNTYNRSEYNFDQLEKLYTAKGKFAADNFAEMGIENIQKVNFPGENPLFSEKEYKKKIPIDILKYAGWVEAFESMGVPSPVNTSHWSGKTDFIFLSPDWNLKITGLYTHYSTLSDHLPLFIDINTKDIQLLDKYKQIGLYPALNTTKYSINEKKSINEKTITSNMIISGKVNFINYTK